MPEEILVWSQESVKKCCLTGMLKLVSVMTEFVHSMWNLSGIKWEGIVITRTSLVNQNVKKAIPKFWEQQTPGTKN